MPTPHLDPTVVDELRRAVDGAVHLHDDSGFVRHSQIFNGAIRSSAQLLVRPLHTQDISEVVKFCARHGLNPSVKSGGYGPHGWSVEGDVIIDMRLIAQVTIERPSPAPSAPDWTPLHESTLATVADPDAFKGKNRMPSTTAYPSAYPAATVGPPPLHVPFTEPRRRSADEAFVEPTVIVEREDAMHVDGAEDQHRSGSGSTESGSGDSDERPSRRLRVTSSASGYTSHDSSTSTPPVHSPHTPADGIPGLEKEYLERTDSSKKIHGPATRDEVEHDEGFLPPTADRPVVGIDGRGFVGRDLGGWNNVWDGESRAAPTESESVGASFAMGMGIVPTVVDNDNATNVGSRESFMNAVAPHPGSMGASSWLWAPPAANPATMSSPLSIPSPPRSNAPSSARPFDFSEPSSAPPSQINAHANPHGNPASHTGALFPGMGNTLFGVSGDGGHRPFDFGPPPPAPSANAVQTSSSSILSVAPSSVYFPRASASTLSPPIAQPLEPSNSTTPVPTVTHVDFTPGPPVPYTYVTFGAGASQKDIDTFCANHPLAAATAPATAENESPGVDGKDERDSRIVADSARPELYVPPSGGNLGPHEGSFFAPGGTNSFHTPTPASYTNPLPSQPSTSHPDPFAAPAPGIPYYVPFAAHPVGSTVMLLGGFGFLSRLRGLSMDCLVEAEVVLPDGRIVWVSKDGVRGEDGELIDEGEDDWEGDGEALDDVEDQANVKDREPGENEEDKGDENEKERTSTPTAEGDHAERPKRGLWWAMRGAGPAFGIVVRYKARAYPVPVVFAGNLIYNFNKLTAASLIKHFRDCIKAAPRELYANCILTAGPRGKGALVVIQICYAGPRAEGLPFLQAISSWEGEGCLLNEVQEKAFVWQQDSVAKVLKGGSGRKWFIRSDLITSLTDEIIHRTVRKFGDTPDGCTWLFELSGGALVDTVDTCLPKCAREAAFTIVALHQWKLEEDDPACVLTAEEWIKDTLAPQSTGGPFPCFLERRERRSRILGVYGAQNWARLCALKKKYDPHGMLRHNFWPLDEEGKPVVDINVMKPGQGGEKTGGHKMDLTLDDRGVPLPV